MNHLLLYIFTGMATGIITGLLGGGSGPILVPILAALLAYQVQSTTVAMHMAVGTSLGIALLAMLISVHAHQRHLLHIKAAAFALLPGGLLGSIIGTVLATSISGSTFKLLFGIIVLLVAAYTFFHSSTHDSEKPLPPPHKTKFFFLSIPLGAVATCFGIGMGPLCVPMLKKYGLSMSQAIAAATLVGTVLVIFATLGFIIAGYHQGSMPPYSIGYVYLPMLAWIGIPTILFARIGAKLTHYFSHQTLKIIFVTFLVVIGIKMLVF